MLTVLNIPAWVQAFSFFLLKITRACSVPLVCPILCDPGDCSPLGSSVHRILQARIREWVAYPSSRESSLPTDQSNQGLLHCRRILYHLSWQGSLKIIVTVCKLCLPTQAWVLLIHSRDVVWWFLVKCKSECVSPPCLQDKAQTWQHGIPSLTWSLPKFPDPPLVTSTPPLTIPCSPAMWRLTCWVFCLFLKKFSFTCWFYVFGSPGARALSSWNAFPCCLPGKLPFAYKMQPWHLLPCQTPCRADWFLFMSQLGFVRFLLRPISPPIGIFYSLHFPSRTLAPQGQIHACSVLHA